MISIDLPMTTENNRQILSQFEIPRVEYDVQLVSLGLINKSFVVSRIPSQKKDYFLQQINHNIFTDIQGLMNNIKVVSDHFESLPSSPNHLTTILTKNGLNYYKTSTGEYWRLYNYVAGKTYHIAENKQMAAEAGKMFGEFLDALSSLNASLLTTTILRFHDVELRYEQLGESLVSASHQRKEEANELLHLVEENIDYVRKIYHSIVNTCNVRATHNDTKMSNLIFDGQQKGICVVDYDTLMPGYLPLEFGDSVRTLCSTTVEDDPAPDKTYFSMTLFESFTTSFIKELSGIITKTELGLLSSSVPYMPFLMGIRMLTDYLNNDIYYGTKYERHNIDRASNQFTLYNSGVEQLHGMNNIVNNTISSLKL